MLLKKIAGCDLGKASAGFFIADVRTDGTLEGGKAARVPHDGNLFEAFKKWYVEKQDRGLCGARSYRPLRRRVEGAGDGYSGRCPHGFQ